MTWTRVQQELRQMRFEELYERRQQRMTLVVNSGRHELQPHAAGC
jgi:hypothetical protein